MIFPVESAAPGSFSIAFAASTTRQAAESLTGLRIASGPRGKSAGARLVSSVFPFVFFVYLFFFVVFSLCVCFWV